jgi:hypothetical protein
MNFSLNRCYDLHLHASPDVIDRKIDDRTQVQQAIAAGMQGCVLKCHAASTAGRAYMLRQLYPEFDTVGSITLNRQVGGLNPLAVEAAAKMGARILWFPTMDARAYLEFKKSPRAAEGLTVLDEDGTVSSSAKQVLEAARDYDLAVCTGHIAPTESMKLLEQAQNIGLKRLCVTHVTLPANKMTLEQLSFCIERGAMIEYSYCHVLTGYTTIEYVVEQIHAIGSSNVVLSSDLGQVTSPYPVEGLRTFAEILHSKGIAVEHLEQMLRINPKALLYGR